MTELVATKPRTKNFNIAVREWEDQIIFLRKLVPGGTNRSYGIQVARIAGLPESVIRRAKEILDNLERSELDETGRPRLANGFLQKDGRENAQLSLFAAPHDRKVIDWIRDLDIAGMTPLKALVELDRLKKYVVSKE